MANCKLVEKITVKHTFDITSFTEYMVVLHCNKEKMDKPSFRNQIVSIDTFEKKT